MICLLGFVCVCVCLANKAVEFVGREGAVLVDMVAVCPEYSEVAKSNGWMSVWR